MERCVVRLVCLSAFVFGSVSVTHAEQPVATYSVEAVAINDVPLPGAPVKMVTASPGEIITAEIYLRDWSPNGEDLRAYQVQLDDKSFQGLVSGTIKPSEYELARKESRENVANAFIDLNRPDFIHAGSQTIAITDTIRAPGYRWLSVLIEIDKAPVSPEDGSKFYCGTVRLTVSADAAGEFHIGPLPDESVSALLTDENRTYGPIHYEPLNITVQPGVVRKNIIASDPPDGTIDARIDAGGAGSPSAWRSINITFDSDASSITEKAFKVASAGDTPVAIERIAHHGDSMTLTLNHAPEPGVWTTITHTPTGNALRFGVLPGDIDGNGVRNSRDLLALLEVLTSGASNPPYRTDLNNDGTVNAEDALAMVDCLVQRLSAKISD